MVYNLNKYFHYLYKYLYKIYKNYYQNALVSSTEEAVNAKTQILANTALQGQFFGKDSPLSDYSKQNLMTSIIHQGQQDFLNHPVTQNTLHILGGMTLGGIIETTLTAINLYNLQEKAYNTYPYAERVIERARQDALYHDFPKQLDDLILRNKAIVGRDGYRLYKAPGSINGVKGNFEIGIIDGQITHRFFNPVK